jgi:dynein heavy chain
LKKSTLIPPRAPIIFIELQLSAEGAGYVTQLEDIRTTIINIYDEAIQSAQAINIERNVVDKIFWKGNSLLESVGLLEPEICKTRKDIEALVNASLRPLLAYAREYDQFIEFHTLKIEDALQKFNLEEMNAKEIKAAVDEQYLLAKLILNDLPSNILIGPYHVQVESVRQKLSKKHKQLGEAILELLVQKLRGQGDAACDLCKSISRKLNEKPVCIEDLTELREWMETVPIELENLTEEVEHAVNDYELVEEFYYPLSQDDFNVRWDAIFWPGKLTKQLEQAHENLIEIEEELKKIQLKDANEFQDRLESLNMGVAGFASFADPTKAHEVANEVRRTMKSLAECQESANMYNTRERLFGLPTTDYSKIQKMQRDFTPYRELWTSASDWVRWFDTWMNDSFNAIDPELLEKQVGECFRTFHKAAKAFKDVPGVLGVAQDYKNRVEEFKPYIPLIQGLRNPGMRIRHWDQLSADIGMNIKPKKDLTFQKCLDMKLQDYTEQINKISDVAAKEYSIEQALDKMEEQWAPIEFEVMEYKDTGTYIIKAPEEASQLLDDHIVMTQSMSFSPFKKPFEERIVSWEQTLRITQDVLDEWMACQRSWLYLEPIFSSDDINRQLPVESKRYQTMDRAWRKIMKNTNENPKVISICADQKLCDKLKECNMLLEQVQKGLSEYLETKRMGFPRFFFLSDDELLEILSQTKDPTAVQPHLRKCFENIARITFGDDLSMSEMTSAEGETVKFSEILYPRGNVENWLTDVERVMMASVREFLKISIAAYPDMERTDWVLKWPGQVVIAGCQTYWAQEVEEAITSNNMVEYCEKVCSMLADLVGLVRGKLSNLERMILSALIVIEVHARDVTLGLRDDGIKSINEFEWISQLRYYWTGEGTVIRAVNAEFEYGYEYLGNSGRLVITPLTDRCYLTLTGALHLKFGGAPAGPAGTGKTETTKDLGKALAIQTVVFNCSDQLDFMAMGKFLKGLASTGAWACFDEFNRIDIEVLSVVAQQITTIQKAQMARAETFAFEGTEIRLIPSCAVFITMNPGYAGRTELPDNLKALFRPVAMMVPNYAMIAEISLYSFGFDEAKVLAHKITATFKLSSEQLSSQDHYDFGMRAVKTVISAAGNLKREHPEMEEELICLRAIRDVNVPKFLLDDLKLFRGIVSDLFPGVKEDPVDYGTLLSSIQESCRSFNLEHVEGFVNKCIQLYETTVVRHGLMLVGPTVSGKTACYKVLADALTRLKGEESISGGVYEAVHVYCLNPKSITMGQLYGEFDPMTHEWTDGILSCLIRQGCNADNLDKRWYMFDGPVDAVWIENMNTVLDDNKKLCLSSGEIIKLSNEMTMMFEVADLAVASPATVSRCGMVYLEPGYIGLEPFVSCWLNNCPPGVNREELKSLFDKYMEPAIDWMRRNVKEIVGSVNGNLVFSLLNLMDTFLNPLKPKEVGLATGGSTTRVKSSSSLGKLQNKLKNLINMKRWYKNIDKKSKN